MLGVALTVRCLGPVARAVLLPELKSGQQLHRHAFCMGHKRADMIACRRDCHAGCASECADHRTPFLRRCHHGASELVVPVRLDERVEVIIHAGPFRLSAQPPALPRHPTGEVQRMRLLLATLEAWLARHLAAHQANSGPGDLVSRSTRYLDAQLSRDPSLSDLADFLGCSKSWAAAQIRTQCGLSWRALKEQRRLQRACQLLRETELPVYTVAERSGFGDADYFVRYFHDKVGVPPLAWRKHQATANDV